MNYFIPVTAIVACSVVAASAMAVPPPAGPVTVVSRAAGVAPFDRTRAVRVAGNGESFIVAKEGDFYWGFVSNKGTTDINGKVVPAGAYVLGVRLKPGTYSASNGLVGTDPIYGVVKSIYTMDAGLIGKPDGIGGFDAATATKIAGLHGAFSIGKQGRVYWVGTNGGGTSKILGPGNYAAENGTFDTDPAYGFDKSAFVMDRTLIAPAPTAKGADLLVGVPAAADSGFFPGTEILLSPALPDVLWGTPYGLRGTRARCKAPGFVPMPAKTARVGPTSAGGSLVTFAGSSIARNIPDVGGKLFEVWTGGANFRTERMAVYRHTGGHGGGNDSTVFATDLDTMRSHRFFPPIKPLFRVADPNSPDFAPQPPFWQAVHNYGSEVAVFDPLVGHHVLFSGTHLFDPVSGYVEQLPQLLDNQTSAVAIADDERASVWLQVTGPSNLLYRFDMASRRWFVHGAGGTPGGWTGGPAGLTNDDRLWFLVPGIAPQGYTNEWAWLAMLPIANVVANPNVGRSFVKIAKWGIPTNFTAAWDKRSKRFIIFAPDPKNNAQGRYWWLDPVTLTVSDLAVGGPPPIASGTWGRFFIDEERDMAITVASEAEDYHGIRIPR